MKRILIWVFILQFATGHNLLAELLRLPTLMEHYQTHLQETPGMGFLKFLNEHYVDIRHQHKNNTHERLPLHCSHAPLAESTLLQSLQVIHFPVLPVLSNHTKLPAFDESLPSSDYESGLFRPPVA